MCHLIHFRFRWTTVGGELLSATVGFKPNVVHHSWLQREFFRLQLAWDKMKSAGIRQDRVVYSWFLVKFGKATIVFGFQMLFWWLQLDQMEFYPLLQVQTILRGYSWFQFQSDSGEILYILWDRFFSSHRFLLDYTQFRHILCDYCWICMLHAVSQDKL